MYTNNVSTGSYFQVSYFAVVEPPCSECQAPTHLRTEDGVPICQRCAGVLNAQAWIAAAFISVEPKHRAKLYRQLSAVFHPDAGGDARLMTALNAVRERFS